MPINLKNIIRFEYGEPVELPLSTVELRELKAYLRCMWQNRRFLEGFQVSSTENPPFFHWEQNVLFPRNYVGFFKFKDWIIEIYPKIFSTQPPVQSIMLNHLLYYLHYAAPKYYAWQTQEGSADTTQGAWLFYQKMILTQMKTYLTQHLYQSYETQTESSPYLRGKIAIKPYLREVLASAKWQQISSKYEMPQIDNPLNQLIKSVLHHWQRQSEEASIQDVISDLLSLLGKVSRRHFTLREARQISLPRPARAAQQMLDFCLYFLEDQIEGLGSKPLQNFAWLLPMERIYEQFIVGFIQTHFPTLELVGQKSTYLASTRKEGRPVFRIQPDIYLPQQQKIIDMKYKLRNASLSQGGVASEDMYQMLSYGLGRQCQNITLLYPARYGLAPSKAQDFEVKEGFLVEKPISVRALDIEISTSIPSGWQDQLEKSLMTQLQGILF